MTDHYVLTGHDPTIDLDGYPGEGTNFLLTVYDDGTHTVAVRPGQGVTGRTWGPPATLAPPVPS